MEWVITKNIVGVLIGKVRFKQILKRREIARESHFGQKK